MKVELTEVRTERDGLSFGWDGLAERAAQSDNFRRLLDWCVDAIQAAINEIHDDIEDTIDACEKLIEIKQALGYDVTDEDREQLQQALISGEHT